MNRHVLQQFYDWKANPDRKPLILRGARQVGKTWLMQHFAAEAFEKSVYINFEDNELLQGIFSHGFDLQRIITELQLATGKTIDSDTLLLFDEIQEAPKGVTSLKYFREKLPKQPIIAAGSLLGISMHNSDSFPVGKVDFIDIHPLSFLEFLEAIGKGRFAELIMSCRWDIITTFANELKSLLKQYYIVGGMPEAVSLFAKNSDFAQVRTVQKNILSAYENDFSKHAPISEVPRIRMVWRSINGQLAKENKKFIYGFLREGARAKDFEVAIEWLKDAGLVHKVNKTKKGALPLSAYEDFNSFKLYLLDIGLIGAMSALPAETILDGDKVFTEFKGAMTEQYVHQQLRLDADNKIYYWAQDNSQGELDFLIQHKGKIIPIEVKAEENLRAKSLRKFIESNPELHGVRLSMSDYREQEWMTNYPLYAVNII